ncbi:MAG TPA: aminotransferase class V-fold PLP-dependent enzyme, partial [Thermoanaerobaculia bacterium]
GALRWREWYAEDRALRAEAASLIGAAAGEISILKNTSEGLSFVAEGYRWERGENVVTTDMEFPSNFTPWKRLERRGVECRLLATHQGGFEVGDLEKVVDAKTRIVSVSSVSFHNGFAPDLIEIGRFCETSGILLCVDAIQSVGAIPIDMRKAKISFLAADGHKWLLGPEGTAIFFCAEQAREKLDVLESGWMNIDRGGKFIGCPTELLEDGRRLEAGSLNTNGVYGLRAAISLIQSIGVDEIGAEVIRIAARLATRLEEIGCTVHTPRPIASGIVAATPPGVDSRRILEIHAALEERAILCAPREGMLRFSPHFYNDESDIERVIEAMRGIISK